MIYFEEIGMICAEEFSAIDLILQNVRDSFLPFGDDLICASGDPKQLSHPGQINLDFAHYAHKCPNGCLKNWVRMVYLLGEPF